MKFQLFFGILVLLVASIMLMANGLASPGPNIWMNQATLSIQDDMNSQDPENSGYTTTQVVVWEEWNGADWDIWMKYSLADGALGTWVFPPVQPASTPNVNEQHPAVAVSRIHPDSAQEIHVVYERWNTEGGGQWDVCHTWTINYGAAWTVPVVLDTHIELEAIEPAIVYTEDLGNPSPANPGMLMQIVWAEEIPEQAGLHQILYDAFYWDPFLPPPRGYISTWVAPPIIIRTSPWGGDCRNPEIASVDEFDPLRVMFVDYDFSVVWEEEDPRPPRNGLRDVWYVDGRTVTSPGPSVSVFIPAGMLSSNTNPYDYFHPDIAATQDYQWGMETHYFHVDWVRQNTNNFNHDIESSYAVGAGSTPGFFSFIGVAPAQSTNNAALDNPTIASKLVSLSPTVFETWMAWEDSAGPGAPTNPDIWYTVGTCTVVGGFVYMAGPPPPPWRVGYVPGVGGGSQEFNPELWNRNDWMRNFPPLTHLVFDQDVGTGFREVVYIDP